MKLAIYGHGGSENHGNEAIVRGVRALFPDAEIVLYSFSPKKDRNFGLNSICKVKPMTIKYDKYSIRHMLIRFIDKLLPKSNLWYRIWFEPFLKEINKDTIYLLEAGDQYCEHGKHREFYGFLNKCIVKRNAKTVMLGCTVNPEYLKHKSLLKDLKRYSLIIARESITYNAILRLIPDINIKMAPCPAFAMKAEKCELPIDFLESKIIGINVGFLAQGNERYYNRLIKNYNRVIEYILHETDYKIALIPHVNWNKVTSDFYTLNIIFKKYKYSNRIFIVKENNAPRQKYIISNCKFFISLRTHAVISALESNVPTIITGYKVKSTGIAKDIFKGKYDILYHVQTLESNDVIKNALIGVIKNEKSIRYYLIKRMPEYLQSMRIIKEEVTRLVNENQS